MRKIGYWANSSGQNDTGRTSFRWTSRGNWLLKGSAKFSLAGGKFRRRIEKRVRAEKTEKRVRADKKIREKSLISVKQVALQTRQVLVRRRRYLLFPSRKPKDSAGSRISASLALGKLGFAVQKKKAPEVPCRSTATRKK